MILAEDKAGNQLYVSSGTVYIHLKAKQQTRKIGVLKDGNLYIRRKKEHIFRKFNAYGFNLALIKSLGLDANIVVKQEAGDTLKTTASNILEHGKILNYLKDGFETQIFMPIGNFTL
jgi:hypothetical protein